MEEVNIYIHNFNSDSLSIVRQVRAWKSRKVRLWISESELKNADKQIQHFVGTWRDKTEVDANIQLDWSLGYYEWDLSACGIVEPISSTGLKAIIQRCRTQKCQFVILGNSKKCKNQFVSFVDARNKPDLPDGWCKCRWMTTFDEIEAFCRKNGVVVFDPVNNLECFQPTGKCEQGEKVYKDLKTEHLIYLDHFHKNHYEAFDQTGRHHLGEISLDGILDTNKADPNKHLTL